MLYFSFISKKEFFYFYYFFIFEKTAKKEALALCKMYIFTIK